MNLSIKGKMYLILLSLISLFFLSTVLFAYFGFDRFYMWQKKQTLAEMGREVAEIYQYNAADDFEAIDTMSSRMGVIITLIDRDKKIAYTSRPSRMGIGKNGAALSRRDIEVDTMWQNHINDEALSEAYDKKTNFVLIRSDVHKVNELVMVQQLVGNSYLVMRQPLAPIQENISIALTFITFSSFICLVIGSITVLLYTRRLTDPLVNLTNLAKDMSALNFSKRWTDEERTDEIGVLGNTLNHLSNELDSTINQLNDSNNRLEQELHKARSLDEMRKSFISGVSHELKTPLALIQGYAEGLTVNSIAENPQTRQHYTSVIVNETNKMDKLVKDLLNLSQVEAKALTLDKTSFNLSLLIEEIVRHLSQAIEEKQILLHQEIGAMPHAYADMLRINQVLTNILTNAIDYTNPQHSITIRSEELSEAYKITIINEGEPIAEEEMEKLWTSFYKIDKARSRQFGGYGLGLSIVRAIQDLHGQKYGVYNSPEGVAFWVTVEKNKRH